MRPSFICFPGPFGPRQGCFSRGRAALGAEPNAIGVNICISAVDEQL